MHLDMPSGRVVQWEANGKLLFVEDHLNAGVEIFSDLAISVNYK